MLAAFYIEIYRILCAFNFLCGTISLMGFDAEGEKKKRGERRRQQVEGKEEREGKEGEGKEAWKNDLTKVKK